MNEAVTGNQQLLPDQGSLFNLDKSEWSREQSCASRLQLCAAAAWQSCWTFAHETDMRGVTAVIRITHQFADCSRTAINLCLCLTDVCHDSEGRATVPPAGKPTHVHV